MKRNEEKITFKKYVAIAEKMRKSENYMLNIKEYKPCEVNAITILVQNDAIFNIFKDAQDMDIDELQVVLEYVLAQKQLNAVISKLKPSLMNPLSQ